MLTQDALSPQITPSNHQIGKVRAEVAAAENRLALAASEASVGHSAEVARVLEVLEDALTGGTFSSAFSAGGGGGGGCVAAGGRGGLAAPDALATLLAKGMVDPRAPPLRATVAGLVAKLDATDGALAALAHELRPQVARATGQSAEAASLAAALRDTVADAERLSRWVHRCARAVGCLGCVSAGGQRGQRGAARATRRAHICACSLCACLLCCLHADARGCARRFALCSHPRSEAVDRCVAVTAAHEATTSASVAALERRLERDVASIPSAAEVAAVMAERCAHVEASLAAAENRSAQAASAARDLLAEANHLQRTLGSRLHHVDLEASAAGRMAREAKAKTDAFTEECVCLFLCVLKHVRTECAARC